MYVCVYSECVWSVCVSECECVYLLVWVHVCMCMVSVIVVTWCNPSNVSVVSSTGNEEDRVCNPRVEDLCDTHTLVSKS